MSLLLTCAGSVSAETALDRETTLQAIHQLENPRNVMRAGPRGELGAYQFRLATWQMHTDVPFSRALDRSISDDVAVLHYEWLKRGLQSAGVAVTPYNIALAWNGGLSAAISGRAPRAARDYAARAANLAAVLRKEAILATAPTREPSSRPVVSAN